MFDVRPIPRRSLLRLSILFFFCFPRPPPTHPSRRTGAAARASGRARPRAGPRPPSPGGRARGPRLFLTPSYNGFCSNSIFSNFFSIFSNFFFLFRNNEPGAVGTTRSEILINQINTNSVQKCCLDFSLDTNSKQAEDGP